MASQSQKRLPKIVDMVGDRIGLNYNVPRRQATEAYVKQHERLDITNLKFSFYSLTEEKTKVSKDGPKTIRQTEAKNPLKLNAKVRKRLYKMSPVEKQQLKYKMMAEIHKVWIQYSREVLALNNGDNSNVYKLDLHGCLLRCTASRNPTLVEKEGIVVQETRNTFLIILKTDRLITLPKRESIFEFKVDDKLFRVHGCNFLHTIQARSKHKYKQQRPMSDV